MYIRQKTLHKRIFWEGIFSTFIIRILKKRRPAFFFSLCFRNGAEPFSFLLFSQFFLAETRMNILRRQQLAGREPHTHTHTASRYIVYFVQGVRGIILRVQTLHFVPTRIFFCSRSGMVDAQTARQQCGVLAGT